MDNKLFHALVRKEEQNLNQRQRDRDAAVKQGLPDPTFWQPLTEPYAFMATLRTHDGQQLGGAISPQNFQLAARNLIGINGTPTHRLATEEEMAEFWKSQAQRRAEGEAREDKLARRDRVVVTSVAPAPREKAA